MSIQVLDRGKRSTFGLPLLEGQELASIAARESPPARFEHQIHCSTSVREIVGDQSRRDLTGLRPSAGSGPLGNGAGKQDANGNSQERNKR